MLKLAIFGAGGRMGGSLLRDLAQFSDYTLVAAIDRADHSAQGQDSGLLAGAGANGIPLSADAAAAVREADAIIDFTFHTSVPGTAALLRETPRPWLIGTTALDAAERAAVEDIARVAPVLLASNMSLGINLLAGLIRRAAAILPPGYDIEVVEMHHRHKKDAPSGTAITLAEAAAEGRKLALDDVACYGRHGVTGERDADTIAIHALRGGDVVGDHTVIFAGDGERIEFTHKASSRQCFSSGALRTIRWLAAQPAGLYSMKDVLPTV